MAGGDEVRALWDTWQGAGGTWAEFWTAEEMPRPVYSQTSGTQDRLWAHLREELPPLLALGRNPYLLLMTAQVYAQSQGELPANRARLFAAFVDTLLAREKKRNPARWLAAQQQVAGLAALAYAMQVEGGRGTTVDRAWAVARLCQAQPGCDAERLLYLAASATLLDADAQKVRFYHQLLQEYFAARELDRRLAAGQRLAGYWPSGQWWQPSGWEETVILLAGMRDDAAGLLSELAGANPVLAARCLLEGDARAEESTRRTITQALSAAMAAKGKPPVARSLAGDALSRLGDPRPGVGLDPGTGLPDIAWCDVPAGPFLMGSDDSDGLAYDDEKPQQEVLIVYGYRIARYPLTNLQYASFLRAQGYQERRYWTDAGWQWKADRAGPVTYGGAFDLLNHPVVGVSWYEAVAFCRWLTERLRATGGIERDEEVRLPTEAEWEKAARGTGGRLFPWGDEFDADRCNMADTGIDTTSAVGAFPGGASPYGLLDMSGNVDEWCRTRWRDSYQEAAGESLEGDALRVVRGGSFDNNQRDRPLRLPLLVRPGQQGLRLWGSGGGGPRCL